MNKITCSDELFCDISDAVCHDMDDSCTVYQINCPDGSGQMTAFHVFPGVDLIYSSFNASTCFCKLNEIDNVNGFKNIKKINSTMGIDNILEISYCIEGRSEYMLRSGSYMYLGRGDLSVNMLYNHAASISFPLKHYLGIDIDIYMDQFSDSIFSMFKDASIDIHKLSRKLCPESQCFIMRAKDKIKNIFCDLYNVPAAIRIPYFKLKILELLLYFNILNVSESNEIRKYYAKQQVETIKQIHGKITENPNKRYTIEELSNKYSIGLTTLKSCFKSVYGTSIGMYIKTYRIQYAATLLQQTSLSISDIAAAAGYENQSRFAAAFKKIMGSSPLKYRKKIAVQSD